MDSSDEEEHPSFKRKGRSKNSAIYGIFGDEEEEDNGNRRGGLGSRRTKPVAFVASKTSTTSSKDPTPSKSDPRAMKKKKKPVKYDRNFGKWEKNTKGFGMKMLMKMGFKGRLGKFEQGTTVPIAVKERRKNAGLGADGHEAVHLKQNKEFERELYGREDEEETEESKTEQNYEIAKEWKRKRVKSKRTFMTASEFLKEQNRENGEKKPTQVVLDCRGPVERTLNSLSDLRNNNSVVKSANQFEGLGKHILYNTEQLVVQAEEDLLRIHRDLRDSTENVNALQREIRLLEKDQKSITTSRYELIERKLADISARVQDLSPHELCRALREIRDLNIKAWTSLDLVRVAREFASIRLRSEIVDWNPIRDGAETIVTLLKPWHAFLFEDSSQIYAEIVQSVTLEKLRKSVTNDWNVRDPSSLITMIGDLRAVLPAQLLESLMQDVVLPKLVRALNDWNPRSDSDDVNIHVWVHPWLHDLLLGEQNPTLCSMWPVVTRRVSTLLKSWEPQELLAHNILKPWSRVLSVKQFKDIMRRRVLPKLANCLRDLNHDNNSTSIDTSALEYTMRWSDMLSNTQLLVFLEGEFFPKWLHALGSRVLELETKQQEGRDFSSIESWYRQWRSVFSSSQLASEPRLVNPFRYALSMISAALFEDFDEVRRLLKAIPLNVTYESIAKRKHRRVQAKKEQSLRKESVARESARRAKQDADKITFRDVVEMFASENGVSFIPNTKRGRVDGKQIYNFDNLFVYIDREVLYVNRGGSVWDPVDLQNLLSAVKSS